MWPQVRLAQYLISRSLVWLRAQSQISVQWPLYTVQFRSSLQCILRFSILSKKQMGIFGSSVTNMPGMERSAVDNMTLVSLVGKASLRKPITMNKATPLDFKGFFLWVTGNTSCYSFLKPVRFTSALWMGYSDMLEKKDTPVIQVLLLYGHRRCGQAQYRFYWLCS